MWKEETWTAIGTGLVMTAAGLLLDVWWLLAIAAACYAIAGILFWRNRKRSSTPPDEKPKEGSTTVRVSGRGKIHLEDSYSSADTFADVEESANLTARRVVHDPARTAGRGAAEQRRGRRWFFGRRRIERDN